MAKAHRPLPPEPATDFDRIGWEICKFANGPECACEKRRTRCCVSAERTVERVLGILSRAASPEDLA